MEKEIFKTINFRIRESKDSIDNKIIFIPEILETSIIDAAGKNPRWTNLTPLAYCYFASYDGALNEIMEFIKGKTPVADIIHDLPELTITIPIEINKHLL